MYEALRARHVSFAARATRLLPEAVVTTAPTLYYRLHGVSDFYRSPYDEPFLARIAFEMQASGAAQAYLYFNHDIDAFAIGNARQTRELVAP